ncbi:NAD-dependent epimerase/dehydratase family protein [Tahibacter caeni]|uniref:NAD-dependent epimerase/dehydratase family protein n=1 Tax=Tahibacter caeni TaxID=1453545 RepID=UPI0021482594|nr:NAD-dependent epimerase/dehydratase family protein [Tahibacter caeni]
MRVAVTGASGFVGKAAVAELLRRGVEVLAVSRKPPEGTLPRGLSYCVLDIAAPPPRLFDRLGRPDVLLHLAWDGLPNYRAERHVAEELPRQLAFLRRCAGEGLQRLVVSGTCLEYGLQEGCLAENLPAQPTTAYALAKDHLRIALDALARETSLRTSWLRLFYLYGEGQASTSLYSQLRAAVARGDARFAMSPGDQRRDFQPLTAAAAQIAAVALHASAEGVVNICSGRPTAVVDLVRQWLQEWGARIELDCGVYDYPDYEPREFWGDRRRLDTLLGTA